MAENRTFAKTDSSVRGGEDGVAELTVRGQSGVATNGRGVATTEASDGRMDVSMFNDEIPMRRRQSASDATWNTTHTQVPLPTRLFLRYSRLLP